MKKMLNTSIFILFLLCYFGIDTIVSLSITNQEDPKPNESLQISYQNLQEEYQKMAETFQLSALEEKQIYSKILFRDPLEFFDIITIQKGKLDGVKTNATVIQGQMLVGIVIETTDHTSKVRLLTNQATNLSVKLKESYGILTTNEKKECWIKNLTKETTIEVGDPVYTSGLTEVPANILIGTVEEIQKDPLGLIQEVKITLAMDENEIHYVTIYQKEELS